MAWTAELITNYYFPCNFIQTYESIITCIHHDTINGDKMQYLGFIMRQGQQRSIIHLPFEIQIFFWIRRRIVCNSLALKKLRSRLIACWVSPLEKEHHLQSQFHINRKGVIDDESFYQCMGYLRNF